MLSYESSASWSSRETFIGEDIGTVPDPTRVDQTYTELVGIYAVCDYPDVRVDPDLNTARTRMWMIEVEVTMADFTRRSVVRPLAAGYKDEWWTACTRARAKLRRRGIQNRMSPWRRKPANHRA